MGNAPPAGFLTFTVHQRNTPPRTWLCGLTEQKHTSITGQTCSIDIHSPFGAGSESDVFISGLSIRPGRERHGASVNTIIVQFVFAGASEVQTELRVKIVNYNTDSMGDNNVGFGPFAWSGTFPGPDGQPAVVVIEFKAGLLQLPYGEVTTIQAG